MEMIRKVLDFEVKKLQDRTYEFTASTSTLDRDGEVIDPLGWDLKNFKKNPVIMYAHDYRTLPIGKAPRVWVSKDGELKNTVEFPPEGTYEFADIVERLVDTGYLKTESVGFIPRKWEDGDGDKAPRRTYLKQELLEISIVPVPSNPDALMNAVNDGIITTKEFDTLSIPGEDITKPEEEGELEPIEKPFPNEHSCRLRNPDDFKEGSFRRTSRTSDGKKYSVIMGRLNGETTMTEQAYRYDKEAWQAGEARTHCKEHEGSFEAASPKEVSQQQILDELDYLIRLIDTEGMNEEVRGDAWKLVAELLRVLGSDIPIDIKEMIAPKPSFPKLPPDSDPRIEMQVDKSQVAEERVAEIVAEEVARAIRKETGAIE